MRICWKFKNRTKIALGTEPNAIKITERSLARILLHSDKINFIFSSVIRLLKKKKIKENKLVQLINNKSQETNKCPGFYYYSLEGMKSNDGEFGTI